jgi:hypothetical protein
MKPVLIAALVLAMLAPSVASAKDQKLETLEEYNKRAAKEAEEEAKKVILVCDDGASVRTDVLYVLRE